MSVHQAPHPATQETTREPILSLSVLGEGPAAVVQVRGPLDMDTVGLLVELVDSVMACQPPLVLVLDLSGVDFFCAAGITALLTVRRRVASGGCALVLRQPSRITVAVLDMVGLADEFTIELTCLPSTSVGSYTTPMGEAYPEVDQPKPAEHAQ
ncbi:STAS domain-containing protein [Micromonospora coerulea]|uniref:STAS domain-containing protein n=1 Tax=Micromonospora coerulea TaxID=47856 RepID=UPI001904E544|nr:STAS domain-containing protein [Micromonospora veneta]